MKKLINAVDDILAQSLSGFGAAHSDILKVNLDPKLVTRADAPLAGKVALLSGGGSGHEPLHAGFVGKGMLTAACPGEVFTSPTPDQMLAAAEAVNGDAGILFIVKNYSGDVMNFEMAAEMAGDMGVDVATVITNDDVAVEDSTFTQGRRGVAGTIVVEKMVGAAAEAGMDLAGCKALGDRINKATGSMGVALTSCTVPAAGKPTFDIGEGEMEMGVGIHGEPGRQRLPIQSAEEVGQTLVDSICESLQPAAGDEVLLLINGMGGTPQMELYLMYEVATRLCEQRGLKITRSLVGNYCTSLEMQGCSITITRLDDELKSLWDAPVRTVALTW